MLLSTAETLQPPSGCSLPPYSALLVGCYLFIHSVNQSIIHSIKPTEHLLRDGESWLLPSGTSQASGSGSKSTDVLVASAGPPGSLMIGRRWAPLCGQSLGTHQPECSLLPAAHQPATVPGYGLRRIPLVSGSAGAPGCLSCLQGG